MQTVAIGSMAGIRALRKLLGHSIGEVRLCRIAGKIGERRSRDALCP